MIVLTPLLPYWKHQLGKNLVNNAEKNYWNSIIFTCCLNKWPQSTSGEPVLDNIWKLEFISLMHYKYWGWNMLTMCVSCYSWSQKSLLYKITFIQEAIINPAHISIDVVEWCLSLIWRKCKVSPLRKALSMTSLNVCWEWITFQFCMS